MLAALPGGWDDGVLGEAPEEATMGGCGACRAGRYVRKQDRIECDHCGDLYALVGDCPVCGATDVAMAFDVCERCALTLARTEHGFDVLMEHANRPKGAPHG